MVVTAVDAAAEGLWICLWKVTCNDLMLRITSDGPHLRALDYIISLLATPNDLSPSFHPPATLPTHGMAAL